MSIVFGKHCNGTTYASLDATRGTLDSLEGTGGDRLSALAALADAVAFVIDDLERQLAEIDALITAEKPKVEPERCAETVDMFGSKS